jgi:hypothetical protein
MAKKKNSGTLLIFGAAVVGLGIWYFTKDTAAAATPPTLPPAGPAGPTLPPAGPTGPTNTGPPPVVYPVISGQQAKVGDKLWASGGQIHIYKNVNPGTDSGWTFAPGDYVGQVMDISPYAYLKMQKFTNPPMYDNAPQNIFYIRKTSTFTKR